MNNKKFFSAALSSVFAFALAAGIVTFSSNSSSSSHSARAHNHRYVTHDVYVAPEDEARAVYNPETDFHALFADEVEIGRDEFSSNLSYSNSTSVSQTLGLSFNSVGVTGWAVNSQNLYVIIDDPNYSGDSSNPSLDPSIEFPTFNGYTVEINPKEATGKVGTDEEGNAIKPIIISDYLTAGKFRIINHTIKAGAYNLTGYSESEYQAATPEEQKEIRKKYPSYIFIGNQITNIEAGAFKNIPSFTKIKIQGSSIPAGWEAGWNDTSAEVVLNYEPVSSLEYSYLDQTIGGYKKDFGRLIKPMVSPSTYVSVTDVNWSGDYDAPERHSTGSGVIDMEAQVVNAFLDQADVYIPEDVSYSNVKGIVNYIAKNGVSFPSSDFQTHGYYDIDEEVYYEKEDADAHKDHHTVTLTNAVKYVSKNGYLPDGRPEEERVYILTRDQYLEIKDTDPTAKPVKKSVYLGPVQRIHVPSGFTFMPNDAISNVPLNVEILLEDAGKPEAWQKNWTDAFEDNIKWSQAFPEEQRHIASPTPTKEYRLPVETTTFIAGYKLREEDRKDRFYCTECQKFIAAEDVAEHEHVSAIQTIPDVTPTYDLPIVVEYDIRRANGSYDKVWQELSLKSEEATATTTTCFDSVGKEIESREFSIVLEDDDDEILYDTFVLHNIFRSKTVRVMGKSASGSVVEDKLLSFTVPDTKVGFKCRINKRFEKAIDITDIIKIRFGGLTKFNDSSMITAKIDKTVGMVDGKMKPCYWYNNIDPITRQNTKSKLDSGAYSVRYVISNLYNSHYRIRYKVNVNGEEKISTSYIPVDTPNPIYVISKTSGNQLSFLVKNKDISKNGSIAGSFSLSKMVSFELIGVQLNVHLFDNKSATRVSQTELTPKFGAAIIKDATDSNSIFDIPSFVIIMLLIISAIYWAGSVAWFFYTKNKYKNDEFRRVRPKLYYKNAVIGYIGLMIVSVFLLFTILRFTVFRNGVAVHNPLDLYVVIPGIISLIVVGYFVKFVANRIKVGKERRRAIKLKLNEDVADDGTN